MDSLMQLLKLAHDTTQLNALVTVTDPGALILKVHITEKLAGARL